MVKCSYSLLLVLAIGSNLWLILGANPPSIGAQPIPPNEDVPEEILQIQVIEQSNSPVDGGSRIATDYALEQKQLRVKPEDVPARIAPQIKQTIDLLRIRKVIKSLLPFF
jgi:hypothetical protein